MSKGPRSRLLYSYRSRDLIRSTLSHQVQFEAMACQPWTANYSLGLNDHEVAHNNDGWLSTRQAAT